MFIRVMQAHDDQNCHTKNLVAAEIQSDKSQDQRRCHEGHANEPINGKIQPVRKYANDPELLIGLACNSLLFCYAEALFSQLPHLVCFCPIMLNPTFFVSDDNGRFCEHLIFPEAAIGAHTAKVGKVRKAVLRHVCDGGLVRVSNSLLIPVIGLGVGRIRHPISSRSRQAIPPL